MKNREWKQLKNKQFAWFGALVLLWIVSLLGLSLFYVVFRNRDIILCMAVVGVSGATCFGIVYSLIRKRMKISKRMEKFIRRNNLYQAHFITKQGLLGEWKKEMMDYYPIVEYREKLQENYFCIRIRMDGSLRSERFRELEQPLADMFRTVCSDRIEERGYLTYCFELNRQEQVKIQSCKDISPVSENEIAFSNGIVWDWKKCPHLMLTGTTGSGKSQLTAYIISCLVKQGVRVIYCDPKNDDDMRLFMRNYPSVEYVTKENDIARVVRETEQEDYQSMIGLATDKYSAIGEMIEHCLQNGIVSYAQLLLFAKENRNDWFRVLCDNGTVTMVQFLKSHYWELSKYEK